MGPPGSVDYDITAPAWMPIKVEGTYDFVTVEGVQGEVFANTVRGDIVIKGGTGRVTAKSVEGEVQVEGAQREGQRQLGEREDHDHRQSGEITAESVNGAITMTGIDSKSVDASTVNGDDRLRGQARRRRALQLRHAQRRAAARRARDVERDVHDADLQRQLQHRPAAPVTTARDMQRGRRVTMTLGNGSADVNLETFGGGDQAAEGVRRGRDRSALVSGGCPALRPAGPPGGGATARSARADPRTSRLSCRPSGNVTTSS